MGGFATILGIADADGTAVQGTMQSFAKKHGEKFSFARGRLASSDAVVMIPGDLRRLTVLLPNGYRKPEELAESLSKGLKSPTFLFHIHDGDFWMYSFYARGKEVDRFNPIPDYWGGATTEETDRWAGIASVVAGSWPSLRSADIEKYLKLWDLESSVPRKAYPDDVYAYNDCYQLIDFMRRLGLTFPIDVEEPVASSKPKKRARSPTKNKSANRNGTNKWEAAWAEALTLKTAAARREALEIVREAPLDAVLRLARAKRQLVSRSLTIPDQHGHRERIYFAGTRRKNVLRDVVRIDLLYWKRKLRIEQILICHEMIVGRVPQGYYDVREAVLAAAGHDGGGRVVNTNSYLLSGDPPRFRSDVERDLPRQKKCNSFRCLWSLRGFGLAEWKRRLEAEDERQLERAMSELEDAVYSVRMDHQVGRTVWETLKPLLSPRLSHSNPDIQLSANRLWNTLQYY